MLTIHVTSLPNSAREDETRHAPREVEHAKSQLLRRRHPPKAKSNARRPNFSKTTAGEYFSGAASAALTNGALSRAKSRIRRSACFARADLIVHAHRHGSRWLHISFCIFNVKVGAYASTLFSGHGIHIYLDVQEQYI